MKEDQIKQLKQLNQGQLCALIIKIYGIDQEIDSTIDSALLVADSGALVTQLKKRIQSIGRGTRFMGYDESNVFSRELSQLVYEINSLQGADPKAAYSLFDALMKIHSKVLNRCDDSGGSVGDVFRGAARQWVEAAVAWQASELPCELNWSKEVMRRHNDNDHGMWDQVVSLSLPLLGEQAMRDLAELFEAEVKARIQISGGRYDYARSGAQLGMRAVAEALADVPMFERSYTLLKEPNELQKENIVRFCLAAHDGESALKWLAGNWGELHAATKKKLLDETYQATGRQDDLLLLRREAYSKEPSFDNLQGLLAISSVKEQAELQVLAASRASASDNPAIAIHTALQLQDYEAVSAYVLRNPDALQQLDYYTLAEWVNSFEEQGLALPAVLAYRVLLLDILESARVKAYRYAAKYYKALERLDNKVVDYQRWPDRAEFHEELVGKHGRKRSFWGLVA